MKILIVWSFFDNVTKTPTCVLGLIHYLATRKRNCFSALRNSVILGKCFNAKLWENSPFISKQLDSIGSVLSKQLANAGKTKFQHFLLSNPRDIEMVGIQFIQKDSKFVIIILNM